MKAKHRRVEGLRKWLIQVNTVKDNRKKKGDKALKLDRTNKGKEMLSICLMGVISS